MYIIKNSSYDLATGGSPILAYLPQNLRTVLVVQEEAVSRLTPAAMRLAKLDADLIDRVEKCRSNAVAQARVLEHEVEKLQADCLKGRPGKADLGEEKILQRYYAGLEGGGFVKLMRLLRGWVGSDGVG